MYCVLVWYKSSRIEEMETKFSAYVEAFKSQYDEHEHDDCSIEISRIDVRSNTECWLDVIFVISSDVTKTVHFALIETENCDCCDMYYLNDNYQCNTQPAVMRVPPKSFEYYALDHIDLRKI